ncbi:hypothetical protein RA8CHR_03212 [Variovorax sp. RA8]|nr:hypothetical protein RA8CHR_03212 [Variovorax sp. RA8]
MLGNGPSEISIHFDFQLFQIGKSIDSLKQVMEQLQINIGGNVQMQPFDFHWILQEFNDFNRVSRIYAARVKFDRKF